MQDIGVIKVYRNGKDTRRLVLLYQIDEPKQPGRLLRALYCSDINRLEPSPNGRGPKKPMFVQLTPSPTGRPRWSDPICTTVLYAPDGSRLLLEQQRQRARLSGEVFDYFADSFNPLTVHIRTR